MSEGIPGNEDKETQINELEHLLKAHIEEGLHKCEISQESIRLGHNFYPILNAFLKPYRHSFKRYEELTGIKIKEFIESYISEQFEVSSHETSRGTIDVDLSDRAIKELEVGIYEVIDTILESRPQPEIASLVKIEHFEDFVKGVRRTVSQKYRILMNKTGVPIRLFVAQYLAQRHQLNMTSVINIVERTRERYTIELVVKNILSTNLEVDKNEILKQVVAQLARGERQHNIKMSPPEILRTIHLGIAKQLIRREVLQICENNPVLEDREILDMLTDVCRQRCNEHTLKLSVEKIDQITKNEIKKVRRNNL